MKTNKPKVQKKVAKKAVKKDLEKTLTERFLEVINQLGHDAGKVGDDISKAGKLIAKKLAKKVTKVQEAVGLKETSEVKKGKKAAALSEEKPGESQNNWTTKPEKAIKHEKAVKGIKQVNKVDGEVKAPKKQVQGVKTDRPKPSPLAQSVKVTPITSEAHAEQALTKAASAKTATPAAKKRASRAKPKAETFPEDPEMPESKEPA